MKFKTLLPLLLAVLLLPACQQTGRIPLDQETQAEKESTQANPIEMRQFADQVAQDMNQKIAAAPVIVNTPGKVTVIMGNFDNKTGTTSTNDFEYLAKRIRSDLINSFASNKLKFVEKRSRMNVLAEREKIGTAATPAEPPAYDPATTYTLNGDFYRLKRQRTNLYYFEFQLVNFGTNEIVFSSSTEYKSISGQ
ncbi:hypothetical protein JD969_05535 [Planctomycetota bacterium]|nr:hypothetical protein JD969_05535 [Planctomycetota bacterium]